MNKQGVIQVIIVLLLLVGLLALIPSEVSSERREEKVVDSIYKPTKNTDFYTMINEYRTNNGLPILNPSKELERAAQLKAEIMISTDCWSHYCPEYVEPWEYFTQARYSYVMAGENLAEGFTKNREALEAWIKSPTHKKNLDNIGYKEQGVFIKCGLTGKNISGCLVVHHFGSRNI